MQPTRAAGRFFPECGQRPRDRAETGYMEGGAKEGGTRGGSGPAAPLLGEPPWHGRLGLNLQVTPRWKVQLQTWKQPHGWATGADAREQRQRREGSGAMSARGLGASGHEAAAETRDCGPRWGSNSVPTNLALTGARPKTRTGQGPKLPCEAEPVLDRTKKRMTHVRGRSSRPQAIASSAQGQRRQRVLRAKESQSPALSRSRHCTNTE